MLKQKPIIVILSVAPASMPPGDILGLPILGLHLRATKSPEHKAQDLHSNKCSINSPELQAVQFQKVPGSRCIFVWRGKPQPAVVSTQAGIEDRPQLAWV